jgi:hypothetical protein
MRDECGAIALQRGLGQYFSIEEQINYTFCVFLFYIWRISGGRSQESLIASSSLSSPITVENITLQHRFVKERKIQNRSTLSFVANEPNHNFKVNVSKKI